MATLSILNGRVIDPAAKLDAITNIHIADEKILAIGTAPADFSADQEIDATNKIVCPGFVDLSVHIQTIDSITKETQAAAANGITTICCPPDSNPIIDTTAVAELLQQRAKATQKAKVLPLAALTQNLEGIQLAEMGILKQAGCIGVSNVQPIVNTEILRHALEYAASCELTVFLHPQDPWLGHKGCAHEGAISTRLGLVGIPEAAETIEIARDLLLIEMTGVHAHFCHLSTARAVDMITAAQAQGLPVTADVSLHQLFLTEQAICDYNSQVHVTPPLRTQNDKASLRQGILDGSINALCADHKALKADAKLSPFSMTTTGISTLDTLLPLTLRFGEETQTDLITTLGYITHKPAQILGIKAGSLTMGNPADICIFNPNIHWTLNEENMHSSGHNSPFIGWELKGKVSQTLINGRVVYENV
jgi:dihydroorotase